MTTTSAATAHPSAEDHLVTRGRYRKSLSGTAFPVGTWLLAAALGAMTLTLAGVLSTRAMVTDTGRDLQNPILLTTRLLSLLVAFVIALWWWRRAPTYPTGRLLYAATLAECVHLVGRNIPDSAAGADLGWASLLVTPILALIVLGWPTGRLSGRTRNVVIGIGVAIGVLSIAGRVFSRAEQYRPHLPDPLEVRFVVPQVSQLLDAGQGLFLQAIPAAALIVVLVRRRRSVPVAVRPLITPITVAGSLLAGTIILNELGFRVFYDWLSTPGGPLSPWETLALAGSAGQCGIVAVGVLIAAIRRRRAVGRDPRRLEVDLRSAVAISTPSATAAAAAGDPTAQVVYRTADGTWVDGLGKDVSLLAAGRKRLVMADESGRPVAAVELCAATGLPPFVAELTVSSVSARSANERAAALAQARRRDVAQHAQAVVQATDRGRQDLERNLHDGAQQLLVGLALTAGLAARRVTAAPTVGGIETDALIDHIKSVRHDILSLIDAGSPAALSGGLSMALGALTAICPIRATLHADGELAGTDPLAVSFYMATNEAIANAVKHSEASAISIRLRVDHRRVRVDVADNGRGGTPAVPSTIADRMAAVGGIAELLSPVGQGTVLRLAAERYRPGESSGTADQS